MCDVSERRCLYRASLTGGETSGWLHGSGISGTHVLSVLERLDWGSWIAGSYRY